jgi:hypothetical protein
MKKLGSRSDSGISEKKMNSCVLTKVTVSIADPDLNVFGLPDPDQLVRDTDPDTSIIEQK